jgi:hypothetical protein
VEAQLVPLSHLMFREKEVAVEVQKILMKLRNKKSFTINLRAGGGGIPTGAAFAFDTLTGGGGGPAGAEVAKTLDFEQEYLRGGGGTAGATGAGIGGGALTAVGGIGGTEAVDGAKHINYPNK